VAFTASARRVRIAATVSAAVLGGSLLAGSTAAADSAPMVPHRPYGTVTAKSGLNVRQYPSTDSSVRYVLRFGQNIGLDCKVRAQNIRGNTFWYKLRGQYSWVSARYVTNHGTVRLCKDVHPTAMNNSVQSEAAMG
jgi:hypothetical protein